MFQSVTRLSCVVFLCATAFGCCTPLEPKPDAVGVAIPKIIIDGEILVSENTNPDQHGYPSPVTIRIYQLKSDDDFRNADFLTLRNNDERVLGADLVFKEEMDVYPGTRFPFDREWDRTARYLGIMAVFRDKENAKWRDLVELPREEIFPIVVKIEGSSMSIWRESKGI
ncbi:MAG: type VI secretion system lipoprotein TssJ [Gammaproteobacteria bacterium]|nr:type VI secretion system lipoprotein TssJ [Gammaproteobacteria bacterium]NNJ84598.1 type VI secretion system lipoprotein TssJ [Gammaproteobacteria bacterium]